MPTTNGSSVFWSPFAVALIGRVENVGHPVDGTAVGFRINRSVMRRDGRRLMADDIHNDGTVYAGIFQHRGHGVAQAVKREGVHDSAFGSFHFSVTLFRRDQTSSYQQLVELAAQRSDPDQALDIFMGARKERGVAVVMDRQLFGDES